MRIGLIRMMYTPFGGAETFMARFIAELERRGHTLEVFSMRWEGAGSGVEGVRVHTVHAGGPKFLRYLLFASRVKRAVERSSPDVVISLERTWCQDIYRAGDGCHREWLRRRARVVSPVKRLMLALNPFHRVVCHLERKLFASPALKKVVANSEMVKGDILRHYGLPEEKICVIYNGINAFDDSAYGSGGAVGARAEVRAAWGIPERATTLLFVGSGFERKGLRYLIRALGSLTRRRADLDLRALVVGKGRTGPYLKEAARHGVADRIVFTGPVEGARRFFPAGDVFVLPTIYEPFSNACLEAFAAGLPVVTTEANGFSEIIEEGVTGSVVADPTDHAGLARAVEPFLDPGTRAGARAEAVRTASEYTIERNVTAFLDLIG